MTPSRPLGWQATSLPSSLRSARPRARRAVVIGLVVVALVVADVLMPVLPGGGMFLVLLVPVIVGAMVLGTRGAIAALGLVAAGATLLAMGRGHPWLTDPSHLVRLGLFLVNGMLVIAFALAARNLAAASRRDRVAPRPTRPAAEPLTTREVEVLALAADGLTTKAIAADLFLSAHTVKSHLCSGYGKLGVRNRAEAVAAAIDAGIIERGGGPAASGPSGRTTD